MSVDFNPYASPLADLETGLRDDAGVYRDGELVRMGVGARLPNRCIRCNESAGGNRLERSFYRRPAWWRWLIWVSLPLLFILNLGGIEPVAVIAFWPTAIALGVGDIFLRRKVAVEYGLCERHWRLRAGVRGGFFGSWVLLIGFSVTGAGGFHAVEHWWFWAIVVAMFVLAIVASMIYRFTLAQVQGEQIWLRGTGRPFFESLPAQHE